MRDAGRAPYHRDPYYYRAGPYDYWAGPYDYRADPYDRPAYDRRPYEADRSVWTGGIAVCDTVDLSFVHRDCKDYAAMFTKLYIFL